MDMMPIGQYTSIPRYNSSRSSHLCNHIGFLYYSYVVILQIEIEYHNVPAEMP